MRYPASRKRADRPARQPPDIIDRQLTPRPSSRQTDFAKSVKAVGRNDNNKNPGPSIPHAVGPICTASAALVLNPRCASMTSSARRPKPSPSDMRPFSGNRPKGPSFEPSSPPRPRPPMTSTAPPPPSAAGRTTRSPASSATWHSPKPIDHPRPRPGGGVRGCKLWRPVQRDRTPGALLRCHFGDKKPPRRARRRACLIFDTITCPAASQRLPAVHRSANRETGRTTRRQTYPFRPREGGSSGFSGSPR